MSDSPGSGSPTGELYYKALFDATLDGILVVDTSGTYVDVNDAMCRILRAPREQLVGARFADFIPGDLVPAAAHAFEDFKEAGAFQGEFPMRAADGTVVELEWTSRANFLPGLHFCVARDVSARKAAERALAAEHRLRSALEASMAAGVAAVDMAGRQTYVNPAFCRMVGWEASELVEREPPFLYWPPEELDAIFDAFGRVMAGDVPEKGFELRFRRRDESRFDGLVLLSPLASGTGETEGYVASIYDVTERKRVEGLLREETEALETINRISAAVAAELDLGTVVGRLTDEATELTGAKFGSFFYNVLDETGESYVLYALSGAPREAFETFPMPRNTDLFAPTFRGEGVVRLDDVTKDPRYGKNPPYDGMPAGHLPVRSYLAVPVVSRSGEVLGGLFFGHPDPGVFTERDARVLVGVAAQAAVAVDNARLFDAARRAREVAERAREQAEEASRAKDEFLAMVSHELRTPLNSMLGWLRLLRSGGLAEATSERGLDTLERNVKSQAQLIEDLLDVSRVISGKLRLDVRPVELADVVEAAVDAVRLPADAKGVRLHSVLDPSAGPVSGDPGRLQQVMWNLLSNAIKFTPKGGRVGVRLARVDSHVEVVVSDTGQGISPEFLPYVFERFRQAEVGGARTHGGLGLGLAIVRHLVELHGGTVDAVSPGEGLGATFTVRLPLMPILPDLATTAPGRGGSQADAADCPDELSNVRVLVVDDEPDTRDILSITLEQCAAIVRSAGSVAEAMDTLDVWEPDVIVSDIGMPGEDGYSLIAKVRARAAERGVVAPPAVALTAYARSEDRMRALAAGFQMHVAKPVEPSELVLVVRSLLGLVGRR